jgi:hypothetical protein
METKLLDSAHGWSTDTTFRLEQYWQVGNREMVGLAKVSVLYLPNSKTCSSAHLVTVDDEAANAESLLRLHAFPSQWWRELALSPGEYLEEPPVLIQEVATELVQRYANLFEVALRD